MNTGKIYFDDEGNECSIFQIIKREPDWIASRFQKLENDNKELIERIISYIETYEVLEDIFKNKENIFQVIRGSFIGTLDSKELLERLTGKTWKEIQESK